MTKTNVINKTEKVIDTRAKAAGLSWRQRRKLKKNIIGFAYDVGVETASRLAVDAVEGTAYLAGRGVVKVGGVVGKAVGTAGKAVKTGVTKTTSKVKGLKKNKAVEQQPA